jgi:UDP-N-acetylglucosamine 4-epimerase
VIVLPLDLAAQLEARPRHWLVTGSAGFIGSHLLETLLRGGQQVTSVDDFSTGHRANLDEVRAMVGEQAWSGHRFIEGDLADERVCESACAGVELVLHQAALGSVPRSIRDPLRTHRANATAFLNMLVAARDSGVKRIIYAASSSTYGDSEQLPKVEDWIGRPLSPYAVTKYVDELYADVFARCYGLPSIGLRYFNVFGPRQDPHGAYAAVIPRWIAAMLRDETCTIFGDGESSRDFCFIANAVQANLRAAFVTEDDAVNQVYNIAVGARTTLKQLHTAIGAALARLRTDVRPRAPQFEGFRSGDIRHSLADVGKARRLLGYEPTHDVAAGLEETVSAYTGRIAGPVRP